MLNDLQRKRLENELDRRGLSLDRVIIREADMGDIVKDPRFTPAQLREGDEVGRWDVDEVVAGLFVGFKRGGCPAREPRVDQTEFETLLQERLERA